MRHRHDFHQLIVCGSGRGVHHVDFEPIEMRPRRVLHVHPGQVHEYQFDPDFDAHVVAFRAGLARATMPGQEWFPGSDVTVMWDLSTDDFVTIRDAVRAIRREQSRFDGSAASVMLIEGLLAVLVARLHQHAGDATTPSALPEAYVRYCEFVEAHFRERPSVASCARELGYSTRTLDRACHTAVGRSAKAVLDERIANDITRLLARTSVPIGHVGAAFGFTDPSSFSKFVTRHLGSPPSAIRARGAGLW
ncbi:MAG: helix-turn-helix transcriptional regulator [Actinomycetota bacterium]